MRRVAVSESGLTLVEALVAVFVLVVAVISSVQGLVVAMATTDAARRETLAVSLAAAKMEQLLAAPAATLSLAPAHVLEHDVAGFVDWIGVDGRCLTSASAALFTRRWSVIPAPPPAIDALILQVRVTGVGRHDREVRLIDVREASR